MAKLKASVGYYICLVAALGLSIGGELSASLTFLAAALVIVSLEPR